MITAMFWFLGWIGASFAFYCRRDPFGNFAGALLALWWPILIVPTITFRVFRSKETTAKNSTEFELT